jgi:hypothetical protein
VWHIFFRENVRPCCDRIGGRTVNERLTTNQRISAPHSFIRAPFVDGLLTLDGLESPSYGYLRSATAFVYSCPIRGRSAPDRLESPSPPRRPGVVLDGAVAEVDEAGEVIARRAAFGVVTPCSNHRLTSCGF